MINTARKDKEVMFPIIEEWRDSGLTKQAFCEQKGIAKSVFFYWHKKYKEEHSAGGFLPIEISGSSSGSFIEIQYPNGIVVRLPGQTQPLTVRQYLHF